MEPATFEICETSQSIHPQTAAWLLEYPGYDRRWKSFLFAIVYNPAGLNQTETALCADPRTARACGEQGTRRAACESLALCNGRYRKLPEAIQSPAGPHPNIALMILEQAANNVT